jgi:hypothetical protein
LFFFCRFLELVKTSLCFQPLLVSFSLHLTTTVSIQKDSWLDKRYNFSIEFKKYYRPNYI